MIELNKNTHHSLTSYNFESINGYIMTFGNSERDVIEKAIIEAENRKRQCLLNLEKCDVFIEECKHLLEINLK